MAHEDAEGELGLGIPTKFMMMIIIIIISIIVVSVIIVVVITISSIISIVYMICFYVELGLGIPKLIPIPEL